MAQGGWAQQTSAGPAPGVTFGGFWIRFVALIIDAIILGVVIGILSSVSASLIYVGWIAELAYLVVCWGVLGQTIGMMPFGLRIVRNADGGKLTWGNVFMRLIGFVVSYIPLCLGFAWAAFDSRKRGWHDMIGGTVVIRNG
jgi:uncharacterized RDD family membrane protein YckC